MFCIFSNSYWYFFPFRFGFLIFVSFFSFYLFVSAEPTLPNNGTHRNKIKKSSFKKSVSNLYPRPSAAAVAVVANLNGTTYLEAKGQEYFENDPHQRHQRTTNAANMDFLISQVSTTTNAACQQPELRKNAGVLILNGINNNLNVKQQLMHHQQQQQHHHLHHQQVQQKMTKKKLKSAQTQLDKLTQIHIHLHGMYYFPIISLSFRRFLFQFIFALSHSPLNSL